METNRTVYKIVYNDGSKPVILKGLLLEENKEYIVIKTEHASYRIFKKQLISINETNLEFRGDS